MVVECKGFGHPDTMTDMVVEACANALDIYYRRNYGKILHYNVDKALFRAGNVEKGIIPKFILSGKVSELSEKLEKLLEETIKNEVGLILPDLLFDIAFELSETGGNLKDIADESTIYANDTSFGVGFYPFTKQEELVLNLRTKLTEMALDGEIGADFKIMSTPNGITICSPLFPENEENYNEACEKIETKLSKIAKTHVDFNIDRHNGFKYISKVGSSIELGDDGQVGRGNRYNGLITPFRPMTIEAYSGKNNRNHTGKLYQKTAQQKAEEIYKETGKPCEVCLVSKIGRPITDFDIIINYIEK